MIHLFQCHAGHLVCSNCRPKLTCCPTCRGQLGGNIRNLAMEKVASTVMFPCRYQSSGCGLSLLHTEKTDHEETCEFRYWKKNIYNVMGISTKTIAACGERLKDFFWELEWWKFIWLWKRNGVIIIYIHYAKLFFFEGIECDKNL